MEHKFRCINVEIVRCDDCEKRFCRGCDEESITDFDEGVIRCGLCVALKKQWERLSKQEDGNSPQP